MGAAVAKALGFGTSETSWADGLDAVGKPPYELVLPPPDEATRASPASGRARNGRS